MAGEAKQRCCKTCWVSNETNKAVRIQASDGRQLTLAPLEQKREVSPEDTAEFRLEEYEQQGYISLARDEDERVRVWPLAALLSGWFALLYATSGLMGGLKNSRYWIVGACSVVGLFCLVVLLELCFGAKLHELRWRSIVGSAKQQLSFLLAAGIAILLPCVLLLLTSGLWQRRPGNGTLGQTNGSTFYSELACRALHLLFISVLSLLPALLFFVLDRECMAALRSKFMRQIFRFDPAVTNKREVLSKYGSMLREAYGPENATSSGRLLAARRSPVLVATLVITIGWSLTFLSGPRPEYKDTQELLSALFTPQKSALTFSFLGSYFYALQTAFRSYIYRDLRPKAYSHITIRIVTMMILAWVLSLLFKKENNESPELLLIFVFLTGIVPQTGIILLWDFVRRSLPERWRGTKRTWPAPVDEHKPLTDLEGIDLYDQSRLLDEGVTNVQSLAHHDVVELMVLTRIPVPRLLDWLDQAILHLHVCGEGTAELLARLREYGIRTATDLENACKDKEIRGYLESLFHSEAAGGEAHTTEGRLQSILESIKDEEWMRNLRYWHKSHPVVELLLKGPKQHSHSPRELFGQPREKDLLGTAETVLH